MPTRLATGSDLKLIHYPSAEPLDFGDGRLYLAGHPTCGAIIPVFVLAFGQDGFLGSAEA
jgi:hypothetical protein